MGRNTNSSGKNTTVVGEVIRFLFHMHVKKHGLSTQVIVAQVWEMLLGSSRIFVSLPNFLKNNSYLNGVNGQLVEHGNMVKRRTTKTGVSLLRPTLVRQKNCQAELDYNFGSQPTKKTPKKSHPPQPS